MAEAVAGRSFKRVTSSPQDGGCRRPRSRAWLLISTSQRAIVSDFVNGLGEAVFRVWRRHSDAKFTGKQIKRAIKGCREIDALCRRLLKSLGGETEEWCRKRQGEGFEEYRAKLDELKYLVAHLNAWSW